MINTTPYRDTGKILRYTKSVYAFVHYVSFSADLLIRGVDDGSYELSHRILMSDYSIYRNVYNHGTDNYGAIINLLNSLPVQDRQPVHDGILQICTSTIFATNRLRTRWDVDDLCNSLRKLPDNESRKALQKHRSAFFRTLRICLLYMQQMYRTLYRWRPTIQHTVDHMHVIYRSIEIAKSFECILYGKEFSGVALPLPPNDEEGSSVSNKGRRLPRTHRIAAVWGLIDHLKLRQSVDKTRLAAFVEAVTGGNIDARPQDTVSYKPPTKDAQEAAAELLKKIGIELNLGASDV